MDKKYLQKYNLMESHKEFLRLSGLNEWSFMPNSLDEAEDEVESDVPPMGGNDEIPQDTNPQGEDPMSSPMPNEQNPPMQGQQDMPMGDDNMLGQDMGDSNNMTSGDSQDILPMSDENDSDEENEDELDVTDLTDAQEKLNKKMNTVGKELQDTSNSITQLDSLLNKIATIIDSNNNKIEELQKEIQKRNPTPLEKLDLRSVEDSKPYNIRPNDYWDEKIKTSPNYTAYDENNPDKDEKEYVITNQDINDTSDNIIGNTFDKFNIDLDKIFGF